MLKSNLPFAEEHDMLRDAFKKFIEKEITPYHEEWEKEGVVPHELWEKAGENGFVCPWADEKYGGIEGDFLCSVIMTAELTKAGASGFALGLHNDIVVPYIDAFADDEQKDRWMPGLVSGKSISAVAMTEPGAGSDLQGIKTTAVKDGDSYVINGQKTFISNGLLADLVIVAAKTDPDADPPYTGLSLIVVERDAPGFERGKKIPKIGMKAQDTAELFFDDCRVPANNLLGTEGSGFFQLMQKLQSERLMCAINGQAMAEQCLDITIEYTQERQQFGRPIFKFQNTQFVLADMAAEVSVGRAYIDRLIQDHMDGKDIVTETCMGKLWVCEMANRVADRCLQLHGGYGYCEEYPISKFWTDGRIQTIFAGTSEVMRMIIARSLSKE
ncbi:MAG: acyl-CoA dehydrogenase [Sulfitobacter sp.]|nr:acyl-CoA dehydrogenase [Sulfitobacter sp.]